MYKLALFSPVIKDHNSLSLLKFIDLYKNKLLIDPIIFCDNITIHIPEQIPIFASLYMKQKFAEYVIITDIEHVSVLDNSLKIIAIYNSSYQNSIQDNTNIKYVSYESDISFVLKEIFL